MFEEQVCPSAGRAIGYEVREYAVVALKVKRVE